jgi:hypothetical protein
MFFSAQQLLAFLVGEFFLRSYDMEQRKDTVTWVAFYHAMWATIPFLFILGFTWSALVPFLLLLVSHALIDRYRLARIIIVIKNYMFPFALKAPSSGGEIILPDHDTGYPVNTPIGLAAALFIVSDVILHLLVNATIIYFLA